MSEKQELSNRPSLVKFAEAVRGEKIPTYQRSILEAIERGDNITFSRLPGRRSFRVMYASWEQCFEQAGGK